MTPKEYKKEILVLLDQPDTEYLYDKAENTDDVEMLSLYVKKAKRIWANNISDADQLINQSTQLNEAN
jgi:hypothetical protein